VIVTQNEKFTIGGCGHAGRKLLGWLSNRQIRKGSLSIVSHQRVWLTILAASEASPPTIYQSILA
jgi:hypothetical protein